MPDTLPFASGSETSQIAAELAQPGARRTARRIYAIVADARSLGMTRDEVVQHFRDLGLEYNSITARVRALVYSGLFSDGPDTRLTIKNRPAGVLRVVDGADFDTLYQEPPPGVGRCTTQERHFLEAVRRILNQVDQELLIPEAQEQLWAEAQRIRVAD